jgi:hypothetical protein
MNARPSTRALVGALASLLVVLAACAVVDVPPPSPSPLPLATAPGAGASPTSGGRVVIDLDQAPDKDVTIEVIDASGTLLDASSGQPGDGASVEPYTVGVSNVDATTLRLVWVDGPCDSVSSLTIDESATRFLLVQPECSGDGVAYDRVLELWFSRTVDAGAVEISLQDGIDTSRS